MKQLRITIVICSVMLIIAGLVLTNNLIGQGRETYLQTRCTTDASGKCEDEDGPWECTDANCTHSLSQYFGSGTASSTLWKYGASEPTDTLTTNDNHTSAQRNVDLEIGEDYYIVLAVNRSGEGSLSAQSSLSD